VHVPGGLRQRAGRSASAAGAQVGRRLRIRGWAERALILALDGFGAVLEDVADTLEPHRLCTYLYEPAKAFSDLWQYCPILTAEDAAVRGNRVALARLTGRTLARGLGLLGIEAPRRL
jgi:arginyl-tRNA synthetase